MIRLGIHPLFFVFGIYFALTGKVFLFLVYTLTALVHEYGHAVCAERLGYKMNKISLMPYGAVVNGALEGLSYKDEITVAMAGPMVNLAICTFFAALWWLVPETYAYTDVAFLSNLSVAAMNLFPAYPLDGGRVLSALIAPKTGYRKAALITRVSGCVFAALCFCLFVWSCVIKTVNFSLLFFGAFLLIGAVKKGKESSYVRAFKNRFSLTAEGVKEVKRLVVPHNLTLKKLLAQLRDDTFYELEIKNPQGRSRYLTRAETERVISSYRLYDEVGEIAREIKNLPVNLPAEDSEKTNFAQIEPNS